jgi:hypothetical protein
MSLLQLQWALAAISRIFLHSVPSSPAFSRRIRGGRGHGFMAAFSSGRFPGLTRCASSIGENRAVLSHRRASVGKSGTALAKRRSEIAGPGCHARDRRC